MSTPNPYQPTATQAAQAQVKPAVTIPREPRLVSYCSFVGFTLFVLGLLCIWPVIFNLLMATDSIASIVSDAPPVIHYLFSFLFAIAGMALIKAALITFKIGNYISLGDRPAFVLQVARVHLFYFPLGTILYFWLRSVVQSGEKAHPHQR